MTPVIGSSTSLQAIMPRKEKTQFVQIYVCKDFSSNFVCNSQKLKQAKCSSKGKQRNCVISVSLKLPWNRFRCKESASNEGNQFWSLGGEDPLEKGMATHSSIPAWKIPWMEEPLYITKNPLFIIYLWLHQVSLVAHRLHSSCGTQAE